MDYPPVQKYISLFSTIHLMNLCARKATALPGQHLQGHALCPEDRIWLLFCLPEFAFYTGPYIHTYIHTHKLDCSGDKTNSSRMENLN